MRQRGAKKKGVQAKEASLKSLLQERDADTEEGLEPGTPTEAAKCCALLDSVFVALSIPVVRLSVLMSLGKLCLSWLNCSAQSNALMRSFVAVSVSFDRHDSKQSQNNAIRIAEYSQKPMKNPRLSASAAGDISCQIKSIRQAMSCDQFILSHVLQGGHKK